MSRNSQRDRQICFDAHIKEDERGRYMICHCCGVRFNPATTKWRSDHIRRKADGGPSTAGNLWPILERCDAGPDGKAARDTSEVAKRKRVESRHYGIRRADGFRRPPPGMRLNWRAGRYERGS
jgi:hypothetical protein